MARSVPRKRNHQDFRGQTIERADAIEPEPAFTGVGVSAPVADLLPLGGPITAARDETLTLVFRSVTLRLHHMDSSVGKILEAAGMIEIEMRQDDVANVARLITHRFDLAERGLAHSETNIEKRVKEFGESWMGLPNILGAISGIDKDETVIRFHKLRSTWNVPEYALAKAVKQRAAERAVRTTLKIMNAHICPFRSSYRPRLRRTARGGKTERRGGAPLVPALA